MKGLSTILAMILIVIIVVALIGLTYTFAVQMVQTSTTGATNATTTVTQNLQKTVDVIAQNCYNTTTSNVVINFTVRASGIALNGELSALLDGTSISSSTYETNSSGVTTNLITTVSLTAGQVKGFSYVGTRTAGSAYTTRTLTVTAPAGDVSETLTNCPAA